MTNIVKDNRKFGLIVGAAFVTLGCWRLYRSGQIDLWLMGIGAVLAILGLLLPRSLTPVRILWEKIGYLLGQINTAILLTLVYVLVVSPIGIINRLRSKDPLKLKKDAQALTYWEDRQADPMINFKRQF